MPVRKAPQPVTSSRMLYFTWVPADPDAVRALVPPSLELADNAQCFINQYVVDSTEQTSGFEAYSLTYAGADLKGLDTPDGAVVDALLQLERRRARLRVRARRAREPRRDHARDRARRTPTPAGSRGLG